MARLRKAHTEHPFYGVARLAIHLGWSEMKTRRIRNLTNIVVPTASKNTATGEDHRRYRQLRTSLGGTPASKTKPGRRMV